MLAHHLVIAPAPDLMELVPDELKHDLVREVTERTIEAWHEARGLNTPEFSYVLHDRDTDQRVWDANAAHACLCLLERLRTASAEASCIG